MTPIHFSGKYIHVHKGQLTLCTVLKLTPIFKLMN